MTHRKGTVAVIMTMTREKAIEILENHTQYYVPIQDLSALKMAIDALRSPTREQVEKAWKGEWQMVSNGNGVCSECHRQDKIDPLAKFCRYCGAPMTDEAVEMVVERLREAIE